MFQNIKYIMVYLYMKKWIVFYYAIYKDYKERYVLV